MELKMKLDQVAINGQLEPQRCARLFTRPAMANIPSYDLARGLDPGSPGVQRARGYMR
jgi:hypothetical protein